MGTSNRRGGPGSSWPPERGSDTTGAAPSFWPQKLTESVVAEAAHPVFDAPTADLPEPLWERWFAQAIEEGMSDELAGLGRLLIREARAQRWDQELLAECGWHDDGEGMLELGLVSPDEAEARWRELLDR